MQPVPPILVFCDLDDTLFEPHNFSVDASARRALDRIEREHVPLVFCSSKTRAELELIQQELGINQPFVCENGAAIFVPRGYFGFRVGQPIDVVGYEVAEFGKPYGEIVGTLRDVADRLDLDVVGFSDMSVEDVAIYCNLTLLQARLAKLREYGELFRVRDAQPAAVPRLFKALRSAGLTCTSRGRYHHVGARRRDVGGQFLRGLYRQQFGEVIAVAFGDHREAIALLRHADIPLVVQPEASQETVQLLADVPSARISVADSLCSWAELILEIAGAVQRRARPCLS